MHKFLFSLLVCAALCAGACSDDDKKDEGSVGSVEMLYGTWGASHMRIEAMGQSSDMDVSASVSTLTFNADGTLTEVQEGNIHAYGTWSYNPATRILHIDDSNYPDIKYDWYVAKLTDSQLIVDFTTTQEGITARMIITYTRMNRSAMAPDRNQSSAASTAVGASLFENVACNKMK